MTAVCSNCDSIFRGADGNEDGSPFIETTRCRYPCCEVYLCQAGCEHLSFFCESCRSRFCGEHKVTVDGMELCADCALRVLEDQEPECECAQSDDDLFDAAGCEFHNPKSRWNVRLKAVQGGVADYCNPPIELAEPETLEIVTSSEWRKL